MVAITFVTHDGREHIIAARAGLSLMENAIAEGVEGIVAVCGGNAYCGTCRVYVAEDWRARLGERSDLETPMIEAAGDENPAVRLSCQIVVAENMDGLVVTTPVSQT